MSILKNELILLSESYEKSPFAKALIKLIPGGSSGDAFVSTLLSKMRSKREKEFFKALDRGDVELNPNTINTNEFLHSYFITASYVLRTRTDEKVKRFANVLLHLGADKITFDEFEDYTSVLNDLTEREFAILALKYETEQRFQPEVGETEFKVNGQVLNPKQVTNLYWNDFKAKAIKELNINLEEFPAILVRVQRTGCYSAHKGYYDSSTDEDGNTTPIFKRLFEIVSM